MDYKKAVPNLLYQDIFQKTLMESDELRESHSQFTLSRCFSKNSTGMDGLQESPIKFILEICVYQDVFQKTLLE